MNLRIIILFLFSIVINAQDKPPKVLNSNKKYKATWESIRAGYSVPEWFKDAKFGIFLHWGPYAVPAYSSEKYPKGIYDSTWSKGGMSPYHYHREHFGDAAKVGYKDFIPYFKAEKFDATEWVKIFKNAGARYVVPVAEHHDGFAMYASNITRWNVKHMGPKKDVMKMLEEACKMEGLKFGVSSHFAYNRKYYLRSDPTWDTNNPRFYDLYGEPIEEGAAPTNAYLNLWWNRTTDIIDNYKPDLLWFDYGLDDEGFVPVHKKILSYYYNKGEEWNKEVVFQDKNMKFNSFPEDLIVLDIERGRMDDINKHVWQTDTSIGKISWGYIDDEQYKSSDYLLDELIDIVSKNGCLLLNIGPKADGTIPTEAKSILKEMGNWLEKNEEAIFNTRPWKIYGEGPTKVAKGNHTEKHNKEAGPEDIRFTAANDNLYAIILGWPKDGTFNIESLAKNNPYEKRALQSVQFISGENELTWKQTSKALEIKVSGTKPCEEAFAFKIRFQ